MAAYDNPDEAPAPTPPIAPTFGGLPPPVIKQILELISSPSDRLVFSRVCRATWACRQELVEEADRFIDAQLVSSVPIHEARAERTELAHRAARRAGAQTMFTQLIMQNLVRHAGVYISGSVLYRHICATPHATWEPPVRMLDCTTHDPWLILLACWTVCTRIESPSVGQLAKFVGVMRDYVRKAECDVPSDWRELQRVWASALMHILTGDSCLTRLLWDAADGSTIGATLDERHTYLALSDDELDRYATRMMGAIDRLVREKVPWRLELPCHPPYGPMRRVVERAFLRLVQPPFPVRLPMRVATLWIAGLSMMPLVHAMTALDWTDRTIDAETYRRLLRRLERDARAKSRRTDSDVAIGAFITGIAACREQVQPDHPSYGPLWDPRWTKLIESCHPHP